MSTDQIITKTGTLLSREGFVTHTGVEIAYHEDNGKRYIRVGSALLWRDDVAEGEDRMTCLCSGSVILL
jgi:hypothetical protein